MVYLLHFAQPFKRIRHWAGATSEPALILALLRGDVSLLRTPVVKAARAEGIDVRVGRTWSDIYSRATELPHRNDRRKLCLVCLEAERERRAK